MAKESKKKKIEQTSQETESETVSETEETAENEEHNSAEESAQAEEQAKKIESLEKEVEELKNKSLRQYAEFDNFKKRTQREKEDLYNYAKADCVEALLGVVDNFERAMETECSDDTFKQGIDMIFVQLNEVLKKLGVEEIKAEGEPFDPELHNAVNQVEDENYGANTVRQVFQKGYRIGERVIRHAMVVVANP